jgi:hypothetical protein
MKSKFILATSVAVVLGMPGTTAWSAGAPLTESKFIEVVGTVQVVGAGGAVRNAKAGDVFKAPDSIQTGANSRAELVADDKTVTRVGANTAFSFAGSGREVNLKKGSLLFHSPTGKGGGTVKSEGATAAVLGTTLAVSATQAGGFKVMTLEGKASVQQPGAPAVSLGAGQMTFATPGQPLSQPLNFSVSGTAGGSKLVNGFSQPLASMPKIEAAIARQQAELEKGGLVATGLFIGDSADKAFKVDSTVVATYVQGKQDESKRTDDKFDLAYLQATTSALTIIDQIAAPSPSIFLLDGKGRAESGLLLPRTVGALAGRISDGQSTQLSLGDTVVISPNEGLLSVLPSAPVDHVVIASMRSMEIGVDNLVVWPMEDLVGGDNRRPVHFVAGTTLLFGKPTEGGVLSGDSVSTPRGLVRIDADLPEVGFYQLGSGLDAATLAARGGGSKAPLKISSVIVSNLYQAEFSTSFESNQSSRVLTPVASVVGISSGEVTSTVEQLIPAGATISVSDDGSATLSTAPVFSSELKAQLNRLGAEYGLVKDGVYSAEVVLSVGGLQQRFRLTDGSTDLTAVGSVAGLQQGWRISAPGFEGESAVVTKVLGESELAGGRVQVDRAATQTGVEVAQVSGAGGLVISAPSVELSTVGLVASGWISVSASGDVVIKDSKVSDPQGDGQFGLAALGNAHPESLDGVLSIRSTAGSILINSTDLTGDSVSLDAASKLSLGQSTSAADASINVDDELSLLVTMTPSSQGSSGQSIAKIIGETLDIYGTGFLSYDVVSLTARGGSENVDVIKLDKSLIRSDTVVLDGGKGNIRIGGPVPESSSIREVSIDELETRVKVIWNKEEYGSKFTATAGKELSVMKTFFDVGEVNLSAKTVVVADTKFREGSQVNFASEQGLLAQNPNTGQPKQLGYVNLIRNVFYGENLITSDKVSQWTDTQKKSIHVSKLK